MAHNASISMSSSAMMKANESMLPARTWLLQGRCWGSMLSQRLLQVFCRAPGSGLEFGVLFFFYGLRLNGYDLFFFDTILTGSPKTRQHLEV